MNDEPKKGLRDQESPLRALWQGIRDAGEADAAHEGHSSRGITEQKGEGRRVSQLSHFKQRETRPLSSSIELHLFTNSVCKKRIEVVIKRYPRVLKLDQ